MTDLSRFERKLLANQFAILQHLEPADSEHYEKFIEILERGYEAEYADIFQEISDTSRIMTPSDCNFVSDVLQMYSMIQSAHNDGQTAGLDKRSLQFPGFDGNNEGKFMAYARFRRKHGDWDYLELETSDFNSHRPTTNRYRRMLVEWEASVDKHNLTAADIVRILEPRTNP